MLVQLPRPALVLLIGASGSGKSTFARQFFLPTEIVSSDYCRALVCDDEANQDVTPDAFDLVRLIVRKRLKNKRFTVVDATNVQAKARARLLALAFQYEVPAVAIVFDLPENTCIERNLLRATRVVAANVIQEQQRDLSVSISKLESEGYAQIIRLGSSEPPS